MFAKHSTLNMSCHLEQWSMFCQIYLPNILYLNRYFPWYINCNVVCATFIANIFIVTKNLLYRYHHHHLYNVMSCRWRLSLQLKTTKKNLQILSSSISSSLSSSSIFLYCLIMNIKIKCFPLSIWNTSYPTNSTEDDKI